MKPRSMAPELSSNLAAMRELANQNTRAALDKHVQKRWYRAAVGKAIVSAVSIGASASLIYLDSDSESITFYAGVIGLVVAIFWSVQSYTLMRQVRKVRAEAPIEARRQRLFNGVTGETHAEDQADDEDAAGDA